MDNNFKYNFEPQKSISRRVDIINLAERVIIEFTSKVQPVLLLCGLFDDEHIAKSFSYADMKPIYEEAMSKDGNRLRLLADMSEAKGEDFWEVMRSPRSKAKTPDSDGFIFRSIPLSDASEWERLTVIKALRVKNKKITFDERTIDEECTFTPTQRMRKLYDMAYEFCQAVNAMNIKRKCIADWLFVEDSKGKIAPSEKGIMFGERHSNGFR